MSLQPNQELGNYRLIEKIGEGGMGVVWKARDTSLDREVAIKILPEALAGDPERLARFEREARVLATLNHTGIAGIYGLHEAAPAVADGPPVRFLAMELVPGEDLAERITRSPLPMDDTIEIGVQIAEALETAHEAGIVHRDLKPANVRLTPDGQVKVLDFGLAKAPGSDTLLSGSDPSITPTMTSAGSFAGMIMGTAAYMSPEQARGRMVDRRTDIWAFGCLLYEMLTGKQAFGGETLSDSMAAVLRAEPDIDAIPDATPRQLRRLLQRCLEKDARQRLRDIGDARLDLLEAAESPIATGVNGAATASSPARAWVFTIAALAVGLVLGAVGFGLIGGGDTAPRQVVRLSSTLPEGFEPANQGLMMPYVAGLSPDGTTVTALGRMKADEGEDPEPNQIWVRRLGDAGFSPLPGTENSRGNPRFSSDGRDILFVSRSSALYLSRVPLDGGKPVSNVVEFGTDWNNDFVPLPDGSVLVTHRDRTSYFQIPSGGGSIGDAIPILFPVESATFRFARAQALPDGQTVLAESVIYDEDGWAVGIAAIDVASGEARVVVDDGGSPNFGPDGHLLFSRGEDLLAVEWDPSRLEIHGEELKILDGLRTVGRYLPASFVVSPSGSLVYAAGGRIGEQRTLVIAELDGDLSEWPVDPRAYSSANPPAVSPDGKTIAAVVTSGRGIDEIWVSEFEQPFLQRVAAFPGADCGRPALSVDGSLLIFTRTANDDRDGIYIQSTDGSGDPRYIAGALEGSLTVPKSLSPDGRFLVIDIFGTHTPYIGLIRIGGEGEGPFPIEPLLETTNANFQAALSPDGRRLAFVSNRSGTNQVLIAPFSSDGKLGRAVGITRNGGDAPTWTVDGQSLHFVDDVRFQRVAIEPGGLRPVGEPVPGLKIEGLRRGINGTMLPDGRGFGIKAGDLENTLDQVEITLNWFDELRSRLDR